MSAGDEVCKTCMGDEERKKGDERMGSKGWGVERNEDRLIKREKRPQ